MAIVKCFPLLHFMTQQDTYIALQAQRVLRTEEFDDFIKESGLKTLLFNFVGFLTDNDSNNLRLVVGSADHGDSYTDGETVVLGMLDHFFARDYGCHDWLTVFKALLAHEIQHVNSSNFSDISYLANLYASHVKSKGIPKKLAEKIAKTFLNIMEDGRIENIIVQKLPGLTLSMLLVNNEIRSLSGPEAVADEPSQEFMHFQGESLSYSITGRHAPNMEVYKGHRLESQFLRVKHYFDEAVEARTSADCTEICRKMLWETADYFSELLQTPEAQAEALQKMGDAPDEYTSNGEREFNESPDKGGAKPNSHAQPAKGSEEKSGDDKSSDGSGEGDGKGRETEDGHGHDGSPNKSNGKNDLRTPPSKEQCLDRENGWTDDFSDSGPEAYDNPALSPRELSALRNGAKAEIKANAEEKNPNYATMRNDSFEGVMNLYAGEQIRMFEESFPSVPNGQLPQELLTTAIRLEKAFERILKQKRSESRFRRNGTLDNRNLYRVGLKDPHIFMRKGTPTKADMAVYELLDNSGSMNACGAILDVGDGSRAHTPKYALARMAASIIERSLQKFAALKISLFDVASGTVRHATVKGFEEKTAGAKAFNSISVFGSGGGNKDGYSIRIATKELLARREYRKVLLILSDGLPSDYNGGERAGMKDVRNAVKEARRKGIIVIPIMFGDAAFRNESKQDFEFMYDFFISCDPGDVAEEFQKLFIRLIQKS